MNDSDLKRLYDLYQSGASSDKGIGSDILQVAKSVGEDLSLDEFSWIAGEIEKASSEKKPAIRNARIWGVADTFYEKQVAYRPPRNSANEPIESDLTLRPDDLAGIDDNVASIPVPDIADPEIGTSAVLPGTPSPGNKSYSSIGQQATDAISTEYLLKHIVSDDDVVSSSHSEAMAAAIATENHADDIVDDRGNNYSPEQAEPTPPAETRKSGTRSALDVAQSAADVGGVFDQTGVTDLVNSAVSVGRAITEPDQAGKHLGNAAISAISAIPLVGDLAKLFKVGGKASAATAKVASKESKILDSAEAIGSVTKTILGDLGSSGGSNGGGGGSEPPGGSSSPSPRDDDSDKNNKSFFDNLLAAFGGIAGGGTGDTRSGRSGFGGFGSFGFGGNQFQPFGAPSNPDDDGTARKMQNLSYAFEDLIRKVPVVGEFLGNFTAGLRNVVQVLHAIDTEGRRLVQTHRDLAQYSGELSLAYSKYDIESEKRKRNAADYMSGSVSDLTESQSNLENALERWSRPYSRAFANLQSTLSQGASYVVDLASRLDAIKGILDGIFAIADRNKPKDDTARNAFEEAANRFFMPVPPEPKLPAAPGGPNR